MMLMIIVWKTELLPAPVVPPTRPWWTPPPAWPTVTRASWLPPVRPMGISTPSRELPCSQELSSSFSPAISSKE